MGHWVKEADQQMRSFWAATAVKAATGFFVLAWADPEPDQQAALRGVPLPSDSPYGSLVAAWVKKLNCFFFVFCFLPVFEAVAWVMTQPKLSNQLLAKLEKKKFENKDGRLDIDTNIWA